MDRLSSELPSTFKGIALCTPGGDVLYCIDPDKQGHWHMQLCTAIAQVLNLADVPTFLAQCCSATVDRWLDRETGQPRIAAEVKPPIWQYRPILEALFDVPLQDWAVSADAVTQGYDQAYLDSHRSRFPQLWDNHNLVLRLDHLSAFQRATNPNLPNTLSGYVLRLFVSGKTGATIQALESLHHILAQTLRHPYTLRVVDVQQHPEMAEQDNITATPTLIKAWPPPVRRIVGTLDQPNRILKVLDLA